MNESEVASESPQYFTTEEVAQMLRTSAASVRYWRAAGKGPRSFKAGRRVLYEASAVEAWTQEHGASGALPSRTKSPEIVTAIPSATSMQTADPQRLMTAEEVAEELRVSTVTLASWRRGHRGPVAIRIGQGLMYERQELERWLRSQAGDPAQTPADVVGTLAATYAAGATDWVRRQESLLHEQTRMIERLEKAASSLALSADRLVLAINRLARTATPPPNGPVDVHSPAVSAVLVAAQGE